MDSAAGSCNACGATGTALMKLSLGKDFFGRTYDRLSPSTDQSPKWYCESCSMQKNLQRDFRDILGRIRQTRGRPRLQPVDPAETFNGPRCGCGKSSPSSMARNRQSSRLLTASDVTQLMDRFQTTTMQA